MNKPVFKIVDDKGRVLIPAQLRTALGIEKGDVVGITTGKGTILVKKAIVLEDNKMTPEAKVCYVQAAVREMDHSALTNLLELAVKLLQEKPLNL